VPVGKDGKDKSRQKPVTPTLHTALRYRLAIGMRKRFPLVPGSVRGSEKCRSVIKAPRRLGRFQPCDMRRFPSLVASYDIALYL